MLKLTNIVQQLYMEQTIREVYILTLFPNLSVAKKTLNGIIHYQNNTREDYEYTVCYTLARKYKKKWKAQIDQMV